MPPPNPTTHHTIHSLFYLFGRSLSFLFSFSFSFLVNITHRHTLLSLTLPPVHSSSSPLPFFRQITGKSSRTSHLHISYWGKSSNLFWWVLCSCLRLFYPSFNNDVLEIYELLGWYPCNFVYGFLIWWTNLMSGFMVLLVVANKVYEWWKFRGFEVYLVK